MPALKPRNRVVVFRLSQDEYNTLQTACASAGGRTISDFTRSELLALIKTDSLGGILQKRFCDLERSVSELRASVVDLTTTLRKTNSNGS